MKHKLFGLTLSQISEIVKELGLPNYTALQITNWLYKNRVSSIDQMLNLSKKARELLKTNYEIGLTLPSTVHNSIDGTKKYLFNIGNTGSIESAYIPEGNRHTLCVSSQVGCKMHCVFCMTGRQGLKSNLTAGEILNQVRSIPESEQLTNIVYMGMGEPMDNLDEVLQSIEILTSDWGFGWGKKRITVSTIGIVPSMRKFLTSTDVHLAVSLHTPFEDERKMLMPISNKYTIKEILNELRKHNLGKQRRVSFEYIVFNELNDTHKHVKELSRILNGINCRINLIRFHEIPNTQLQPTNENRLHIFKDALNAKGILTTIRASRGQDIYAACGLLSTKKG